MSLDPTCFTFGHLPDGTVVDGVTLSNRNGMTATLITYGATLQSLTMHDRHGRPADLVLGHAELGGYLTKPQYFGSTVGRLANRIANGRFNVDGLTYQIECNDGPNALHGGEAGFDKRLWEILDVSQGDAASATFGLLSLDGDQGFPGNLATEARFGLGDNNRLTIDYSATTDRPTVVNISNHTYWNLAGEGSSEGVMGHRLTIPAASFLPVDASLIPVGTLEAVDGTPFDFREARAIGVQIRDARHLQIVTGRGYDHCWVFSETPEGLPHLMARVDDPGSGRSLEIWSDQPGLQFYSGNFLDGSTVGKSGRAYRMGDALVLEPQRLPDCINQPALGSARLAPGQTYRNRIEYRFRIEP